MHGFYSDEIATKYTFGRALTEGESWRTVAGLGIKLAMTDQ